MSRGFSEEEAMGLIVNGFFEPFRRTPDGIRRGTQQVARVRNGGFHRINADMAVPSVLFICGDTLHGHAFIRPKLTRSPKPRVYASTFLKAERSSRVPPIVNPTTSGVCSWVTWRVCLDVESTGAGAIVHIQAIASGHVAVGHLHLSLKRRGRHAPSFRRGRLDRSSHHR